MVTLERFTADLDSATAWIGDVDPVADAETSIQVAKSLASAGSAMIAFAQKVPAGSAKHSTDPDKRRDAYLEFQARVWEQFVNAQYIVVFADVARKPPIVSRLWNGTGRALDAVEQSTDSFTKFLAAVTAVRLVGNPEPRAAAERLVGMVGSMLSSLPTAGSKAERVAKQQEYAMWQGRIGEAMKDFTIIARRDLGYAAKLREHWWQYRRPTSEEEWPGGWPSSTAPHGQEAGDTPQLEGP